MRKYFTIFAMLLAFLAGCIATPRREVKPVIMPLRPASLQEQEKRTADFRKLISGLKLRGTGCFVSAVVNSSIPTEQVMSAVKAMGFNRIYAFITSESELDEKLSGFLAAASKFELPVEIVLYQRDFFDRSRGKPLLRLFLPKYPDLPQAAGLVAEFNSKLPAEHRIAGLTVVLEPHFFDHVAARAPYGQLYVWSEDSYGIGLDNDMLMHRSFDMLKKVPSKIGSLPLTVAIQDFFHENAAKGLLSIGTVKDFAAAVSPMPRLLISNAGNRPTQLVGAVADEFANAPDGADIAVVVNLADHTSVSAGALRRRDWNDMMRSLNYMLKHCSAYPAFSGIVIGPLSSLEFLRTEKD